MRDIKFRFFDGVKMNHNIMGYDYNCGGPIKDVLAVWNDKNECIDYYDMNDEEFELTQYIGMKDAKGKEIYEGDIVTAIYNGLLGGDEDVTGVIEYCDKDMTYVIRETETKVWFISTLEEEEIKVIGNKYQNEDLLNLGPIKVERYFKTIKHPLGEGLYIKISSEFQFRVDAEKFKNNHIWDEEVEVIEVSKEEYEAETDTDNKKVRKQTILK